jgi:hypothetical protein
MANALFCVVVLSTMAADAPVSLRPVDTVGETARVVVSLKGSGLFKPADAKETGPAAKPLALKVETRVEFIEKILELGTDKTASRVVRRVERAAAVINGEVRPSASALRPDVAVLVAELRGGQAVVVSPGGPLTRAELELVQGPGDPLALTALLPAAAVAKGDSWGVGSDAARSLSGYDSLDDNALKATLDSVDDAKAIIRLKGAVRGSTLGSQGTITFDGKFTFDRKAQRVESLEVERAEVRQPGPVEAGLDVKSTLSVNRTAADLPAELSDAALKDVPLEIKPDRELLLFRSPDGKYSMVHDRNWHIYWDGDRQSVLKRLVKGQVVAHCNLTAGPNAGKGRHQDPAQLREDIRKAAGSRFVKILGEGTVDGPAEAGYRYKITVQGRDGDLVLLWYYYLLAGPEGDQILAVFTLGLDQQDAFGDQDLRLIGTFEWLAPPAKP